MKFIAIAAAVVLASTSFASAGQWGQRSENTNVNVSQSNAQSRSSARAQGGNAQSVANNAGNTQTTNFRDRLQAPGFGVGGGYCADGLSISFPGGGFGFTSMARMCKTEMGARVANTYLGRQSAAQYVCSQSEFRNLSACRPARR